MIELKGKVRLHHSRGFTSYCVAEDLVIDLPPLSPSASRPLVLYCIAPVSIVLQGIEPESILVGTERDERVTFSQEITCGSRIEVMNLLGKCWHVSTVPPASH